MRLVLAALLASIGLIVAATVSNAAPGAVRSGLFDYDRSAPLGVAFAQKVTRAGIVQQELSYQATASLRLKALFVHPSSGGPWPLVIWSPGYGGDRRQQLPEALTLARGGAASLLIDEIPLTWDCRQVQHDLGIHVDYVISRRRAVDLAGSLANVDAKRIAASGFSRGAAVTADLAGVERRIHFFVLRSGRGHFSGYIPMFCASLSPAEQRAYIAAIGVVDPVRWVGKASGATFLIQDGTKDELSPRGDVLALYAAAKGRKELRWYRADHPLNAAATAERDRWLLDHLK